MAVKSLTNDFRKSYGIDCEGAYTLDADAQYLIIGSYSDSLDWFVMGAASSKDALSMFANAMRYCASHRSNIYVFESGMMNAYYIKSMKSDRYIMVCAVPLGDDSFTVEDDCSATMPVDWVGAVTREMRAFAHQECGQ